MSQEQSSGDNFDLSQFHGVFFDEAAEHLAEMESLLLGIDVASPDAEQLNAIFRAAHSIKGGAATFGFQDITELTHEMETVFDKVRKGQMPLSTDLVNTFLASGDMLKSMLSARRGDGAGVQADEVAALCVRLRAFLDPAAASTPKSATASKPASAPAPVPAPEAKKTEEAKPGKQTLELVFGPFDGKFTAASVDPVVADLRDFGKLEEVATPADKANQERRFHILTDVSQADLTEALAFMADPKKITVRLAESAPQAVAAQPAAEDKSFGLFVDPASLPANQSAPAQAAKSGMAGKPADAKVVDMHGAKPAAGQQAAQHAGQASGDSSSIRVGVQKVDQLINLVGELVITQAMLAQTASQSDPVLYEALFNGLAQLQRNTRDLQEAAMSIRMMPMSFAFSRFPRVVRDVAAKLGKEVDLHTIGEGTELDKGLIERIVDPLTHLVRNSLDHGLESPDEREAKGKVRKGTITLRAYHQGGAIVIEVSDDGRGLRRDKILSKAKERGMAVSDAMSDQEVWALIFEAGFSTADVVTDVSGRGVGMDVVRRNINEMGGRVEIESTADVGTRISIKLPLTLAILDGMSVRVGKEIFIIPLGYISESLQPKSEALSTIGGRNRVVSVRGDYLPVVSLADVCNVRGDKQRCEEGILVILEAEGNKTALFVDDLVGQHQVVIKSMESNYRKIQGVSGATIMGDGRVAMILDVTHIVGISHSRLERAA